LGHGRRAAKDKTRSALAQFIRGLGEFTQKALARFRRQPVRNADQVGLLLTRGAQEFIDRDGRAKKNGAPAGNFGQIKKIHDAGNMDAFPQGARNNGFHRTTSCSIVE
jgi:hypothetical protein